MNDSNLTPGPGRRRLFTSIALAIPVLFFILAEATLRLAGVGEHYPLFIDHPSQPDYQLANPDAIKRFFGDPAQAPAMRIETVFFASNKPKDGLRIVVQGGSTAAGFPYGFGASLSGMLEQRLRRAYPQRPVEVINTAMSAVNSYTLLDFADEIIEVEPDAVLIYAGHNEYLGILGVGSAYLGGQPPWLTRWYLRLRQLHLFQWLQGLFSSTPDNGKQGALQADQGTMMSRVARDKDIEFGSRAYRRGVAQFQVNLSALVQRYTDAGIPVFIGTLVSNETQQPFIGSPGMHVDHERWRQQLAKAKALLKTDPAEALNAAAVATQEFPLSADAFHLLGQARLAQGDYAGARQALQAARDRDRLRFRAPGVFNDLIAEASAGDGVYAVDVQAAFRDAADNGILGDALLLEHVHPTLHGYFLLADAFFDQLQQQAIVGTPMHDLDDEQAWSEAPVSEVDRLFGEYKVGLIKSNWPFTESPSRPRLPVADSVPAMLAQQLYRQQTDWASAHSQLAQFYQNNGQRDRYLQTVLILADAFPFRSRLQFDAGVALIEAGRHRQALNYLYRAGQQAPRDINVLLALSHALILNRAHDTAREVLQRVLILDPGNMTATKALRQLEAVSN